MKLYELTGEYLELLEMMENCEEGEEQVLRDTLDHPGADSGGRKV